MIDFLSITEKKYYKPIVSILFGLIGFIINFFPVDVVIPPNKVSYHIGVLFPLIISIAWGWKYGLVSATLGLGCQSMWFIWVPLNGWAPFVTIPGYTIWVVWHGWCSKNSRFKALQNFYIAEIPYRVFNTIVNYTLLPLAFKFNPSPWAPMMKLTSAPDPFVNFVVFKHISEGIIILLAIDVLMQFRVIQRLLKLEEEKFRNKAFIVSASLLFGILFWLLDGFLSYLFYKQKVVFMNLHPNPTLADTLIVNISNEDLITRISFILTCLVAGLAISKFFFKYRESQASLAQSEERYREIFNSPNEAIFMHDATTGRILDVNRAMLDMYGYSKDEVLGMSVEKLSEGAYPYTQEEAFYKIKKAQFEGPQTFEWLSKKKDGYLFWTEVGLKVSQFGGSQYVIAVIRNIHERKLAEVTLAEEKERLAVTLASIGDGVITTDTSGSIVLMNRVAEILTGWTIKQSIGAPLSKIFNIINQKTRERCQNPVEMVISTGKIIGLANHTCLISKDGAERLIADSGAPIFDASGRIIGVVLVFRDETEKIKIEEELHKIKKLESVEVLAGGIAHDFNNILVSILGNLNLALRHVEPGDKVYQLIMEAEKASHRAKGLTQQLLTFARGGEPVMVTTSLAEIIKESVEFILHGGNITCEYNIPDDLWFVDIDRDQIYQVFQNLLLNSMHAMHKGGRIIIKCENIESIEAEHIPLDHDKKFIKISLEDSGPGIPNDILEKIFDPYFTTKDAGSGLGLTITHSIILKHGGHISAGNKPNGGALFTIYLPASEDVADIVTDEDHIPTHVGLRIMIMDDEESVRIVSRGILEHLGHEATLVKDGNEAIQTYSALYGTDEQIDIIIMDLTIPGGMGGEEAVKKILEINQSAKIIVSSGYSNDPILASYRHYGFSAILIKPFNIDDMARAINQAIS